MKALPALVVDVVAITVFAILGRSSHAEASTLFGVLQTAWPFLVGAALGHALYRVMPSLRADPIGWRPGAVVWVSSLIGGMVLRLGSGDTAAWPFVVVAALVLALFLLGWRAVFRLTQRARNRTGVSV